MSYKTLTDVANTQPGQYVSGKFSGTISNTAERQSKTGKAFYKAMLTDGIVNIDVTSFSTDMRQFEGQLVMIGGMGIKRGEDYKGIPQISVGEKTVITSQGGAVAAPAQAAAKPATMRVEGITIGACMNKAVDIAISNGNTSEDHIWQTASMLLRVNARLQTGDLHSPKAQDNEERNVPF